MDERRTMSVAGRPRARRLLAASGAVLVGAILVAVSPSTAGYVIAVLCGLLYVTFRGPRLPGPRSVATGTRAALFVATAVALLLPALIGTLAAINGVVRRLFRSNAGLDWAAVVLFSLVVLACLLAAVRWQAAEGWFLVVVSAAFLVVKVIYLLLVEMEPTSDFGAMWNLAEKVSSEGLAAATGARGHITRLYLERILAYLLPLNVLFGSSRWAYGLPNAVVTIACSLLTYQLSRRWFGKRAARVAFTVSLIAIEPTLASGIPSHDVPGALFTLLAIVAFLDIDRAITARNLWRASVTSLALGAVLMLADLQRTNRLLLVITFAAFVVVAIEGDVVVSSRPRLCWTIAGTRALLLLALPLVVVGLSEIGLTAAELRMDTQVRSLWRNRAIAGHSDSWTDGSQRYFMENYYYRYRHLSAEEWGAFARRKLVSDFYFNPKERVRNFAHKSAKLFTLGRQLRFYIRGAELQGRGEVGPGLSRRIALVNRWFVVVFLVLMGLGVLSVWRDLRIDPEALLPAFYLAVLSGSLVLVFQVQARYMFQIWYLGAVYIGGLSRAMTVSGRPLPRRLLGALGQSWRVRLWWP